MQEDQESVIPSFLPLSSEHISNDGIYLLENGHDCLIYVGDSVSSDILQRLFGFATVDEIPTLVLSSLSFSSVFWFSIDSWSVKFYNWLIGAVNKPNTGVYGLKVGKI